MHNRPSPRRFVCWVAAIHFVAATGCSDDYIHIHSDAATPVAYQTLDDSRTLRVFGPSVRVFRDGADWEAFWSAHVTVVDFEGNPLPSPAIAFDQEMLIGVFWGNQGSGCRRLVDAIGSIMRYDDRVEVHVGELPFLGHCQTLIQPLQIVVTEQIDEPVVFTGLVP